MPDAALRRVEPGYGSFAQKFAIATAGNGKQRLAEKRRLESDFVEYRPFAFGEATSGFEIARSDGLDLRLLAETRRNDGDEQQAVNPNVAHTC
ncbi:MAG TPA: hypothetical protein PKC18_00700 [Lacipirellulaceae bacterium]|nr:hypothetical protein [Lacipirellulaceae bacterium]HMP05002.1 hypothetical protein [Lacipirellulaceae bacterium]